MALPRTARALWAAKRSASQGCCAPRRQLHLHRRTVPAAAPSAEPPLVFIHGLFGSSSNFGSLARRCNAKRAVVLPDLRNHGASPWDADCSLEAMAADVLELLDAEGLSSATLCGHSLGGKVAMACAMLAPERVERLLVVDIAPVSYRARHPGWVANRGIIAAMEGMAAEALGSRKGADAALREAGVAEAGIRAFLLQNLLPDEARWRMNLAALSEAAPTLAGWPEGLPAAPPTLPALFVAGGRSDYCTAEHRAAIDAAFPGAAGRATRVLDAGHWVHAERPDEFVELVNGFLDEA